MTEPSGAIVRRRGADLGDAPVTLGIPEGETWTLTISAEGYESKGVDVSCEAESVHVVLEPLEEDEPVRMVRMLGPTMQTTMATQTEMTTMTTMTGMTGMRTDPFHDPWDD